MELVIVTGMSGAGKSTVLKFLEDLNFFCVDNLPPFLMPKFIEVCYMKGSKLDNVALGIDIRGGDIFDDLFNVLESLEKQNRNYSILFLEASDEILLNRYKESRRSHPLAKNDRIITGINKERQLMLDLKKKSKYIIDTSHLLTRKLKEKINDIFVKDEKFDNLMITIMSFGFKYGIPIDSDLVFDVRFIPNPYYINTMKELTGNNKVVSDYVLKFEESLIFMQKLVDMMTFLIPKYINEGKNQLVISIGCTGGKHRSVTLANELINALHNLGHSAIINHRDIDKDTKNLSN